MTTKTRPIRQSDHDAWLRMFTAYLHFYETDISDEAKAIAFDRLISADTKVNGIIAEHDDVPVGFVHYIFHDHMWRPEGVVYLQDLFADDAVRGQGVGASLINAVYDASDAAGVPAVYWMTQDFNKTARKLYDRIGVHTPFIRYNRP